MANRSQRARIAEETVAVVNRGWYATPAGERVSIAAALDHARTYTLLRTPDDFDDLGRRCAAALAERPRHDTRFEVVNETTLAAAARLTAELPGVRVLALNFASAKNPGGGFLGGSQAQEESLARASGLYPCLLAQPDYYTANRACSTCLYTDHMIYAPDVPVFRDDHDAFLERPYLLSFLTAPAVNAGALRRHETSRTEPVMRARVEKVLTVAVLHGHDTLVLGAWGCGVFRNDPERVAEWFAEQLTGTGPFCGAFARVVFAVLDRSGRGEKIEPFARRFGTAAS
jgi:uncharacterized protein (TIGR02452 family)